MTLILESLCKPCFEKNCKGHLSGRTITDKITGLTLEVRCVCDAHGGALHEIDVEESQQCP